MSPYESPAPGQTIRVRFECGCFTIINLQHIERSGNSCCKEHEAAGQLGMKGKTVAAVRWPEKVNPVGP